MIPGPGAVPAAARHGSSAGVHPLATVSLVLSVLGFFALPVVGGLLGSLLGAVALRATSRNPERWSGRNRATVGIVLGLVNGVLMFSIFALVRHDDWGDGPVLAAVIYAATIGALIGSTRSPHGALWGGALAAGGVAALAVVVIAGVLAVAFILRTIVREILCGVGAGCAMAGR